MYIRTGFVQNGTWWNNKALGVDSSWKVVYVDANGLNTPIFNLLGNYIPKLNNAGDNLEVSVMYQNNGLVWVNMVNPGKSVDILWNFRVQTTQWSNVQYNYTYLNSNTGLSYPAVDITTAPLCAICDLNPNAADCNGWTFIAPIDYGPYCIDATSNTNGNFYNHNVYIRSIVGIPQTVLTTSWAYVGIGTDNPIVDLHVSGSWVALFETWGYSKQFMVLENTSTFTWAFWSISFYPWFWTQRLTIQTLWPQPNSMPDVIIHPINCILWVCFNPKVWIGLSNPSEKLHVQWNVRANAFILNSDAALKNLGGTIANALDKLDLINGYYYTWEQEEFDTPWQWNTAGIRYNSSIDIWSEPQIKQRPEWNQMWFLAQEIRDAFPEVPWITVEDNNGILWVNYIELMPVLVQAIKEQQAMIEQLQADVLVLQQQ